MVARSVANNVFVAIAGAPLLPLLRVCASPFCRGVVCNHVDNHSSLSTLFAKQQTFRMWKNQSLSTLEETEQNISRSSIDSQCVAKNQVEHRATPQTSDSQTTPQRVGIRLRYFAFTITLVICYQMSTGQQSLRLSPSHNRLGGG